MSEFELGPVQEQWLKNLEAYPERQCDGILGQKRDDGSYVACCLGEFLLTYYRAQGWVEPFKNGGYLYDDDEQETLSYSADALGLNSENGGLRDPVTDKIYVVSETMPRITCLASMNDHGWSWPEIAAFVRENPELVFFKSV